jgi:hypothetical protein
MATDCSSLARGRAMRLTRLDECGVPVEGPASTVVTKGYVSVTVTPVYSDVEDITQTDANGDTCIDDQSDPALRWLTLSMVFCLIDPDAINIITGDPLVLDDAAVPNTVGYRIDQAVTGTANFALELWSGRPGQACGVGETESFGYWLFPYVVQAQWGEWVIENGALTLTLTARTSSGSGWGVGPYDIRRDATVPATLEPLLTAISPTQHVHFQTTSAPIPTAGCGAVALPPA